MTKDFKEKFYEEEHEISSFYYKKDNPTSIIVSSDIHYHPNVNKEIFRLLVSHIRETNPDFVIMPGDLIETINFIDNSKEKEFFERFIRDIAEVSPLIMIPGNHEIGNFDTNKYVKRDYSDNKKSLNYFDSLNKIKNVYFLNNEKTSIKGMVFVGFSPRLSTYLKNNFETQEELIEDYLKSGLSMAENDYNILLTHSPMLLKEPMVLNSIADFNSLTDLVISGHFHDGYLPKKLDKYLGKTNVGLFFTPLISPIPGIICRGVHDFGRGYLFVSQGFRKWTADIKLFNSFEKFTANDVEKLILSKEKPKTKN